MRERETEIQQCKLLKKPNIQLLLTTGPILMIGGLLAKLFCQVVQSLKSTNLCKEPLLVAFLCLLQALPCTGYILLPQWK